MFLIHGPKGLNGWFAVVEASSMAGARRKFREASGLTDTSSWTIVRLKANEHGVLLSRLG